MENEKNIISSQAKISAIAGMMFFAPFVKNNVKSESELTESERNFVLGYVQVGYVNLVFLGILAITRIITLLKLPNNLYRIENIANRIETISSLAIFTITIFSLFACASETPMRGKDEQVIHDIPQKNQILKAFVPVLNFVLRFRQADYNKPYRWLKESIFARTAFIICTLLFGNITGIGILILISVRLVLLLINIDIIPLSMKRKIHNAFYCNPTEIFSRLSASLITKLKKSDFETSLRNEKQKYIQGQNLGLGIIIQYVLFLGLLFWMYHSSVLVNQIILIIAFVMLISKIIIFYHYKKALPRIPILSEIVGLIVK